MAGSAARISAPRNDSSATNGEVEIAFGATQRHAQPVVFSRREKPDASRRTAFANQERRPGAERFVGGASALNGAVRCDARELGAAAFDAGSGVVFPPGESERAVGERHGVEGDDVR